MHISLKFNNLDREFKVSWPALRQLVTMVKRIYPKTSVEVTTEFTFADSFFADPAREVILPKDLVGVDIVADAEGDFSFLNPQYNHLTLQIVKQAIQFLGESDPRNDPSIQPSYFPDTNIMISLGYGTHIYVNGLPSKNY